MAMTPNRNCASRVFVGNGFWIVLALMGLYVVPLFFHYSGSPSIGTYSRAYLLMLFVATCGALGVAGVIARASGRRGDLLPAHALIMVVAVVTVLLVIAEVLLRIANPESFAGYKEWGSKRSLLFGFEPTPSFRWVAAGATYNTDQFTFRVHPSDFDWAKAVGTPADAEMKIFVLGGSSVFGFGLNDTETWPHLLEANLRKAFPQRQITVINAGANGHNSLQSMLRLYLRILPHKPTHVIYYEGINDAKPHLRSIDDAQVSEAILFSTTLHDYILKVNRNKNLYLRTNLGYTLSGLINRLSEKPSYSEDPYRERPEILLKNGEVFVRNVEMLSDICKRYGVELVLVTFLHNDKQIKPFTSTALKYYGELQRDVAAREGHLLLDLEKDFRAVDNKALYFFEDHYHPSKLGAQYIAASVAAGLEAVLPPASSATIQRSPTR